MHLTQKGEVTQISLKHTVRTKVQNNCSALEGNQFIHKKVEDQHYNACLQATVKHHGGSLQVCG